MKICWKCENMLKNVKMCVYVWKCLILCFFDNQTMRGKYACWDHEKHEWIREGKIIRSSLLWSCITDMHSIDCTVCNMCSLIALMDQRMWRLLAFGVIWIRIFLDGGGLGEHRCRSLSSRRSFQRSCSDHGMDMKRWSWKCLFSKKHSTTNC